MNRLGVKKCGKNAKYNKIKKIRAENMSFYVESKGKMQRRNQGR